MNARPIELLGNTHLTKAEIEHRKNNQIAFGGESLCCPAFVAENKIAYAKWGELVDKYSGQAFISSADEGHLARYCMLYAEYRDLLEHRARIANIDFTSFEMEEVISEFEIERGKDAAKRMWKKIEYIISTDGIISIDKAINSKAAILMQMEDRLFLNPLAKVKNIPKRQNKEPDKDETDELLDAI